MPELKNLKKIMIDKKITAIELATAVECSPVTISRILNGHHKPNIKLALKIATYINEPIEKCFVEYIPKQY